MLPGQEEGAHRCDGPRPVPGVLGILLLPDRRRARRLRLGLHLAGGDFWQPALLPRGPAPPPDPRLPPARRPRGSRHDQGLAADWGGGRPPLARLVLGELLSEHPCELARAARADRLVRPGRAGARGRPRPLLACDEGMPQGQGPRRGQRGLRRGCPGGRVASRGRRRTRPAGPRCRSSPSPPPPRARPSALRPSTPARWGG